MTTLEEFRELAARGEAMPDDSEVHAFMVETGERTRRLTARLNDLPKIGRASCRERV